MPMVIVAYFLLAKFVQDKAAKYFLIFASIVFYSYWDIRNLPILAFSIFVNFIVGRRLNVTLDLY